MQIFQSLAQKGSQFSVTYPDGTKGTKTARYEVGEIKGKYRDMLAVIADTSGFDGLGFDSTVGSADDSWHTVNLFTQNHRYIDTVAVAGADDSDHAIYVALSQFDYLEPDYGKLVANDPENGFDNLGFSADTIQKLLDNLNQSQHYLPIISKKMLLDEQHKASFDDVAWDGLNLVSHGKSFDNLYRDMLKHDSFGELTQKFSLREALAQLGDIAELGFDSLMDTHNRLQLMGDRLYRGLVSAGDKELQVTSFNLTKPFKRQGVANVAMDFSLSDGQTFSIFFKNPDADPAKIGANDVMVSWKWLLNKKDITAVVQPENGKNIQLSQVAMRMMKLAKANMGRFASAQAQKAKNEQEITKAQQAVADKQALLETLDKEIADLQGQIDAKRHEHKQAFGGDVAGVENQDESDEPINLTGDEFGEFDISTNEGQKAYIEKVAEYLDTLNEKSVYNASLQADIVIGRNAIDKSLYYNGLNQSPIKMQAMAKILEILKQAKIFKPSKESYDDKEKRNKMIYHYLKTPFFVNGVEYGARIVVRQDKSNDKYYYDFQVKDNVNVILDSLQKDSPEEFPLTHSGLVQGYETNVNTDDNESQAIFDKVGGSTGNMVLNLFIFDEHGNEIKDEISGSAYQALTSDDELIFAGDAKNSYARGLRLNDMKKEINQNAKGDLRAFIKKMSSITSEPLDVSIAYGFYKYFSGNSKGYQDIMHLISLLTGMGIVKSSYDNKSKKILQKMAEYVGIEYFDNRDVYDGDFYKFINDLYNAFVAKTNSESMPIDLDVAGVGENQAENQPVENTSHQFKFELGQAYLDFSFGAEAWLVIGRRLDINVNYGNATEEYIAINRVGITNIGKHSTPERIGVDRKTGLAYQTKLKPITLDEDMKLSLYKLFSAEHMAKIYNQDKTNFEPQGYEFLTLDELLNILKVGENQDKAQQNDTPIANERIDLTGSELSDTTPPQITIDGKYYKVKVSNDEYLRASTNNGKWTINHSDDGQIYAKTKRFSSLDELIQAYPIYRELPNMVADKQAEENTQDDIEYDKSKFTLVNSIGNWFLTLKEDKNFVGVLSTEDSYDDGLQAYGVSINMPEDSIKKLYKLDRFKEFIEYNSVYGTYKKDYVAEFAFGLQNSVNKLSKVILEMFDEVNKSRQLSAKSPIYQQVIEVLDLQESEGYADDDIFVLSDDDFAGDYNTVLHNRTIAFAKGLKSVFDICQSQGFDIIIGDFNHTLSKGLFDALGDDDNSVVVQIGQSGKVARCAIDDDGRITVLSGASGDKGFRAVKYDKVNAIKDYIEQALQESGLMAGVVQDEPVATPSQSEENTDVMKSEIENLEKDFFNMAKKFGFDSNDISKETYNLDNGGKVNQYVIDVFFDDYPEVTLYTEYHYNSSQGTKVISRMSDDGELWLIENDPLKGLQDFKDYVEKIQNPLDESTPASQDTTEESVKNYPQTRASIKDKKSADDILESMEMFYGLAEQFTSLNSLETLARQAITYPSWQVFLSEKTNGALQFAGQNADEILETLKKYFNYQPSKQELMKEAVKQRELQERELKLQQNREIEQAFLDKTGVELARAKSQLQKLVNTPKFGEQTYKAFIENLIDNQGYKPKQGEFMKQKGENAGDRKTVYMIGDDSGSVYTINKTQYQYATWYYEHKLQSSQDEPIQENEPNIPTSQDESQILKSELLKLGFNQNGNDFTQLFLRGKYNQTNIKLRLGNHALKFEIDQYDKNSRSYPVNKVVDFNELNANDVITTIKSYTKGYKAGGAVTNYSQANMQDVDMLIVLKPQFEQLGFDYVTLNEGRLGFYLTMKKDDIDVKITPKGEDVEVSCFNQFVDDKEVFATTDVQGMVDFVQDMLASSKEYQAEQDEQQAFSDDSDKLYEYLDKGWFGDGDKEDLKPILDKYRHDPRLSEQVAQWEQQHKNWLQENNMNESNYTQSDIDYLNSIIDGTIDLEAVDMDKMIEIGEKDENDPLYAQALQIVSDYLDEISK